MTPTSDAAPPAMPTSWLLVRTESGRRWMLPGASIAWAEASPEPLSSADRKRLIRQQWVAVQAELDGRDGALPLGRGGDETAGWPWMILVLRREPPVAVRVQVERVGAHALEAPTP